jgi:hypothetical protein
MQPGITGRLRAEGKQRVLPVFGFAAGEAAAERRVRRIAVEPFGDTASECAGLGFVPKQAAVELGNARRSSKKVLQSSPDQPSPPVRSSAITCAL